MTAAEMESEHMVHVRQKVYELKCNWKVCYLALALVVGLCECSEVEHSTLVTSQVYNDNYLDGCYHCSFAHPGLSLVSFLPSYIIYSVCLQRWFES